jgi:hypothetical protein
MDPEAQGGSDIFCLFCICHISKMDIDRSLIFLCPNTLKSKQKNAPYSIPEFQGTWEILQKECQKQTHSTSP